MLQFFAFFIIFRIPYRTSLKLRFVKVGRGILQDKVFSITVLRAVCFGTPNINTQFYNNFTIFFEFFLTIFVIF